jgi:hypothetical protein
VAAGLRPSLDRVADAIQAAGITYASPFAHVRAPHPEASEEKTLRRGRPVIWRPGDYARVALTYDDARREGASPILAIAKAHNISSAQARNLIAKARANGFIPQAPKQGKAAELLPDSKREELQEIARTSKRSKGSVR